MDFTTFKVTIETDTESRYNYRQVLRVWHKGELILEELDSGEPEDNCFHRDYKWVRPMIEKAYELGRQDAKEN